nr:hypothetical protein [Tanacetum cinerariifolium]
MLFGFGVHPVTLDPTLLKVNYPYYGQGPWYVSVFTSSSRTWYKLDSYCLPRESIRIKWPGQAVVIDMPEEMLAGQCIPPYYISQLGDCNIIYGSFKFVDFSIIYAWELQVDDGEVSCTHAEPSPLTPNPVTIIPGPAGIVQLSSSTRVEPSSSTSNLVKIIPGPAGLVQERCNQFTCDAILEGDYIDNFLKKGKLEQVVAIVKFCSSNALGDLNVTLKDLSGTIPGTINYKVFDVDSYGKDITVGTAMILANVSVFIPKPSKHYINITKRNVIVVFRKDTVLESGSG